MALDAHAATILADAQEIILPSPHASEDGGTLYFLPTIKLISSKAIWAAAITVVWP